MNRRWRARMQLLAAALQEEREFEKPLVLRAPCAVPRGSCDFSAMVSEARRDMLGSAVLRLPWQWCRRPGLRVPLWLHWGSGGCMTELLPSWWFLGSPQCTGRLSAKLKVLQIPQTLPSTQVDVSTSSYSCTLAWEMASSFSWRLWLSETELLWYVLQSTDGERWTEKWTKPKPSINSQNATHSLPPSCFQTFDTPCQLEHSNEPLHIWKEEGRGAQNPSVMNFSSNVPSCSLQ